MGADIPYSRVVRRTPLISAYSLLGGGSFGMVVCAGSLTIDVGSKVIFELRKFSLSFLWHQTAG